MTRRGRAYCWLGGARYPRPLDPTSARKWAALAAGLDARLYVVGFAMDARPRHFQQFARFYLLPWLPPAPLRYLTLSVFGPPLALWLILRRGVTVLVAQSPYEGAAAALVKGIARLFGKKVALVVESHGDFEVSVFMQRRVWLPGIYRALMQIAARYACRRADALRAVSSATADQLAGYAPDTPLARFMAWIDSATFLDAGRDRAAPHESRDILFAGVLIRRKGVHILLDAFASLGAPDATLTLAGAFENPVYTAEMRHKAGSLGIADCVRFLGNVSPADLAAAMARARALVLPSLSEGLPRVLVEAMLCGTPVIASRVSGIPDVVRDGDNGLLVPPGDVEALAAALDRVMTGMEVDTMGERARAFAREFFSPEAYVDGHRRLFALLEGESDAAGS